MKQYIIGLFLLCLGIILIFPILGGWVLRVFMLFLGFHLFFAGLDMLLGKHKNQKNRHFSDQTRYGQDRHWRP